MREVSVCAMRIIAKLSCLRCKETGKVPSLTVDREGEVIETGVWIDCPSCQGRGWKKARQVPVDIYDDSY